MHVSEFTQKLLEDLGEQIKQARIDCNLSQFELGEKIGVTRYTIGSLESGQAKVAIGTVFEAANAVGLNISGMEGASRVSLVGDNSEFGRVTLDDDYF